MRARYLQRLSAAGGGLMLPGTALNLTETLAALAGLVGRVVQVGVGGSAVGDPPVPLRMQGRLEADPLERSKFRLVAGSGRLRLELGVLEITPAAFDSAESYSGGLLLVNLGPLQVAIQDAEAG